MKEMETLVPLNRSKEYLNNKLEQRCLKIRIRVCKLNKINRIELIRLSRRTNRLPLRIQIL